MKTVITGIAHACYVVKDLDKAEAFYRDVLGLKSAFDFTSESGHRFGVYLHVGHRTFIELFEGGGERGESTGSYRHLCLEVDDIRGVVESIRAAGTEVSDAKLGSDGSYQAWLNDPDGNRIELHQYLPGCRQEPWCRA
jgi:lactoylglutathione lyase/glyoxylase I family protein